MKHLLHFSFALLVLVACDDPENPPFQQGSEFAEGLGMDPQRLAEIPTRMQEFVDEGRIAGAVMVLARRDGIVLLEAVGYQDMDAEAPMQTDAIFRMASVAKPITAMGIMALHEEGRLLLRAPLERYLPQFQGIGVEGSDEPAPSPWLVTLLTHMSGVASEEDLFDTRFMANTLADVVDTYAKHPLRSEPGEMFTYSSPGFDILGRVIEVVSGQPFEVFMEDRFFRPLGMEDSGFFVPAEKRGRLPSFYRFEDGRLLKGARPNSYAGDLPHEGRIFPAPAFGLYSTAEDLGALLQMLLNEGMYEDRLLLSPASVTTMSSDQTRDDSLPPWGLGWAVSRRAGSVGGPYASVRVYGHDGSTGVNVWIDPDADLAGAFLVHQADIEAYYARSIFMTMAYSAITGR